MKKHNIPVWGDVKMKLELIDLKHQEKDELIGELADKENPFELYTTEYTCKACGRKFTSWSSAHCLEHLCNGKLSKAI